MWAYAEMTMRMHRRLVGDKLPLLFLDQRLQCFFRSGKEHCRCRAGAFRLRDETQWQIAPIIDIRLLRALGRRIQRLVCPRPLREEAWLRHVFRVSVYPQHARDARAQAVP